ncbi:MAG: queuosine precursor transporter [Bacteroidota bacterium]|uniref:Queuosine precursor transporter n=1 Tax=marine metagenome TaxID=408172 RepID=A0A381NJN9_9ZZZZ|nr:queuosine precursor transporter [Bacteroidota bacterium]
MNTFSTTEQNKRNNIFFILSGIFITNAIIAEILGTKIFEFDFILNFNMSVGVIIWPVVFITTDIINEYFGKKGIKKISYFTILLIIYVFIIIYMSTKLTPNNYWLNINSVDNHGNPFNIDYAYNIIFLQSTGIIIGSIIAFLIAQILDVIIFHKLKRMTKGKFIWLRATGSTLISQFIDSFVVLFIAFYLLAPNDKVWSLSQVFSVGFDNYTFKFIIAILITPLIYLAHYLIDNYMGEALAKKCKNKASNI